MLLLFLSHSLFLALSPSHRHSAIILWRHRWSRVNSFQVKYLCIIIYISFYSFIGVHIILFIFCTYLYNNILYYYTVLLFYKSSSIPTEQPDIIITPTLAPYLFCKYYINAYIKNQDDYYNLVFSSILGSIL